MRRPRPTSPRCAACRAFTADLEALDIDVPASLDARVLSTQGARAAAWWTPMLAIAAVLVAAVALAVVYRKQPDDARHQRRQRPDANGAAAPAVRQAGTWEVKKPALLLPLATALVVRGEAEEVSRALGAALAPYRTDDYVAAERLLEAVVGEVPGVGRRVVLSGLHPPARWRPRRRTRGARPRRAPVALATATTKPRGCWRRRKRGLGELDAARTKLDRACVMATARSRRAACNATRQSDAVGDRAAG